MRLRKDYILREMGETRILVNEGELVNLTRVLPVNETAAFLWQKAGDTDFTEEWLAKQLMEEYDIDAQTASEGAKEMVSSWRKYNLLVE